MKSIYLKTAVAVVLMGVTAAAMAARPPDKGPPAAESSNNLSMPLIMIDGEFALNCAANDWTPLDAVEGTPVWYDESCAPTPDGEPVCVDAGYYFVQGVHQWQAPCMDKTYVEGEPRIDVYGAWGDNFAGDAKLKVGSPIRVELRLDYAVPDSLQLDGYKVIKLEPLELDRESAYGTLATANGAGSYAATPVLMTPLIHDGVATFSIQNVATGTYVVPPGSNPTAEINATGKVIYGYNLRVSTAGDYDITFKIPNVNLTGCNHTDAPTDVCSGDTTTLRITVVAGGGRRPR